MTKAKAKPKPKSSASTTFVKRKDFNDLARRVEELEMENADLAARVKTLEARLQLGSQSAHLPSVEGFIDPPSVGWGA